MTAYEIGIANAHNALDCSSREGGVVVSISYARVNVVDTAREYKVNAEEAMIAFDNEIAVLLKKDVAATATKLRAALDLLS